MAVEQRKARAAAWFRALRDQICGAFEAIEDDLQGTPHADLPAGRFERKIWDRPEGGGGEISLMRGRVFEKVGVNISTVHGHFSEDFRQQIPGAAEDGAFWASGISLVAHMRSPLVPAVHMNTRHIVTTKAWFGGGADLNPPLPYEDDTREFHETLQAACDAHGASYYERYKAWADDYFYIPHRQVHRGVGGIFYDHLECPEAAAWEANFAFTQDVGRAFLAIFPQLVRRRMAQAFTVDDKRRQLEWRGRYAEFNLVYDRGTLFGLKTGGNIDAILMSLPPEATWA